jgi:hypothetical protein
MGENICMFSKSTSSGVESINRANQFAQQKNAVDILNVTILLLKLEGECFAWYKQKAWERDNVMTDKGLALMEECFANVNVCEYWMTITPVADGHRATMIKTTKNANKCSAVIPSKGRFGLRN